MSGRANAETGSEAHIGLSAVSSFGPEIVILFCCSAISAFDQLRRRAFITLLGGAAVSVPLAALFSTEAASAQKISRSAKSYLLRRIQDSVGASCSRSQCQEP
jgi:hypothetical protein